MGVKDGGCINVLDEHFLYVTEDAQLWYDHQGGWGWGEGGVLTFLTSTSLTLRKMHTLRMLSYDHQGGCGWGWEGGFEFVVLS